MSRTPDAVLVELLGSLPSGFAWDRAPDREMAAVLKPLAAQLAQVEGEAERLLGEIDPRQAFTLLGDYERVLGPDPCGRDLLLTNAGDRRAYAHQRWTARQQPTPAALARIAAQLGVTVTIEEFEAPRCGAAVCGDVCADEPEIFTWIIRLPTTREIVPEDGVTECGETAGSFAPAGVECVLRLAAPAHTAPVFAYS